MDMLNVRAWKLPGASELALAGLSITVLMADFVFNHFWWSNTRHDQRRVPYFLIVGIYVLNLSAAGYLWAFAPDAILPAALWLSQAGAFSSAFLVGFALGWAAAVRSVNICGHAGKGWIGLVPVANLILVFSTPQNPGPGRGINGNVLDVAGVAVDAGLWVLGQVIEQPAEGFILERNAPLTPDPRLPMQSQTCALPLASCLRCRRKAPRSATSDAWMN